MTYVATYVAMLLVAVLAYALGAWMSSKIAREDAEREHKASDMQPMIVVRQSVLAAIIDERDKLHDRVVELEAKLVRAEELRDQARSQADRWGAQRDEARALLDAATRAAAQEKP